METAATTPLQPSGSTVAPTAAPKTPTTAAALPGGMDQVQLWHLTAICCLEAPTRQGRIDVLQAIFNRLNAPKAGYVFYGKTITDIVFASGQFEPFFPQNMPGGPKAIQSRADVVKWLTKKRGMSTAQAEAAINQFLADADNVQMMTDSRSFVGGRTDFKGTTQYGSMIKGVDRLRQAGENFFHSSPYTVPTAAQMKKMEQLGPTSLSGAASALVSATGATGLGCADPGMGGQQTITQTNAQSQGDALMQALGLMNQIQGKAIEFRAYLEISADPNILDLDAQKSFELKNIGEGLDGTYTCHDVIFTYNDRIETYVMAYQPDPNAPQPQVFMHDTNKGLAPQTGSQVSTNVSTAGLQWCMPVDKVNVAGQRCEFGYSRGRLHAGIDLGGYGPDEVFAAGDGIVDFVANIGEAGGYGRLIDIKHSPGLMTRYAHLAKVNVKKGDPIKRGQLIGIRGGSGSRSDKDYDIHLHHEVIVNGNPVDPRSVLPKPGPPNV